MENGRRKMEEGRKLNTDDSNLTDMVERLKEFLEQEARSCSMDFGCVTPLYVYRMFGGQFSMEDIEVGLRDLRKTRSELRGFRESGI